MVFSVFASILSSISSSQLDTVPPLSKNSPVVAEIFGKRVGVRVVRILPEGSNNQGGGQLAEELYVKDKAGIFHLVLVSPVHPSVQQQRDFMPQVTALTGAEKGLFQSPPTFAFTSANKNEKTGQIQLISRSSIGDITKTITVPSDDVVLGVEVQTKFTSTDPSIRYLLDSYAFAPDGKKMSIYGRPDSTYSPAIRPKKEMIISDHFFRAPVISVQRGSLAALMMPNLDVLAANRPIPTIMDLDCMNGVVDAPLLSYGFADHRVAGHVYHATDPSMVRGVPQFLKFSSEVMLDADAEPYGAFRSATAYTWKRYGHGYFNKVLPQALSFEQYAKVCYPAAFEEVRNGKKLGWFEEKIGDYVCGGVSSGWGYPTTGAVSWQCWFNQIRTAWGLRWWGKKSGNTDWIERSEKMLNFALAAPMDRGAVPTTYQRFAKSWHGSLLMPDPKCYYDLTNMAWKGIWLLRWTKFDDCPRREEILKQCLEMADCMVRNQNSDGSIPSWLSKDHKVIPVLDHSAQTSLPAWFLADMAALDVQVNPNKAKHFQAAKKAADFLMKEVVDGQYYYDFETFFSCSPKACFQRNGKVDHEKMRDPHTLCPPQNTLCMQWTAEALRAMRHLTGDSKYMPYALKALDMMSLYQNVWPMNYRKVAYNYGGFGVQNSDGEYNDARQAQFGDTLCDFGAELGDRSYFERGVAGIRASLTLINHPRHIELGLCPNPNYALGLEAENNGHGGTDQINGRTGFDWGEGSGLVSMAYLLDKYGSAFVHEKNGWAVGIDGLVAGDNQFASPIPELIGKAVTVKYSSGKSDRFEVLPLPKLPTPTLEMIDGKPMIKVSIKEGANLSLVYRSGKMQKVPANGLLLADVNELQGPVTVRGTVDRWTVESPSTRLYVNPTFDFMDGMTDWVVDGDFSQIPSNSRRVDFRNQGKPFIGTAEHETKEWDDDQTGVITSPEFYSTASRIRLLVGGGGHDDAYVELIRVRDGKRLFIERGRFTEQMDERIWDLSPFKGEKLQIRIVDRQKGDWGHINVGNIRSEE